MPEYIFRTTDQSGGLPVEMRYEFPDVEAARQEAKTALAEMAQDGLPGEDLHRISVEVLDVSRNSIMELRLTLQEIDGAPLWRRIA